MVRDWSPKLGLWVEGEWIIFKTKFTISSKKLLDWSHWTRTKGVGDWPPWTRCLGGGGLNDCFIISQSFKQRFGGLIPMDYHYSWRGIDPPAVGVSVEGVWMMFSSYLSLSSKGLGDWSPWTRSLGGGGLNEFSSHFVWKYGLSRVDK